MKEKQKPYKFDEQRRQAVIADYALLGSYKSVADKHRISEHTVKRYVTMNIDNTTALCEQKKAETTKTVLDYLESTANRQQNIIGKLLSRLEDQAAIDKLQPVQAATIYGIMVDKATLGAGKQAVNINLNFGSSAPNDIDKFGK